MPNYRRFALDPSTGFMHEAERGAWIRFAEIEQEVRTPCVCGDSSVQGVFHRTDGPCYIAVEEATKPQEPVGYQELFNAIAAATSVTCFPGINISIADFTAKIGPLFTTPQHCPKCAEGMVSVTKEDANNYCRILTLLGMEEEGSPVEGVERLISLRDGMTCGDCNDTGWLENREEGRYPCTCMTEAEPYQLLEAERDDWKSRYESSLSVNQMHSDNNAEMLKFNAKLLAERDALAMQNQQIREAFTAMFAKYEDGTPCYDEPECGTFIGYAMYLDEAQFKSCVDALTRHNNTEAIIKRHDAAVLQKGAEYAFTQTGQNEGLTLSQEEIERLLK